MNVMMNGLMAMIATTALGAKTHDRTYECVLKRLNTTLTVRFESAVNGWSHKFSNEVHYERVVEEKDYPREDFSKDAF